MARSFCRIWLKGCVLALLLANAMLAAPASAQAPVYITQWGSPGSGDGQFNIANGVAADASGNVYVLDRGLARIQRFTSSGGYIAQWGWQPWKSSASGIATDPAGDVYMTDGWGLFTPGVRKFTSTGAGIWGKIATPADECGGENPIGGDGVATDAAGNVYVLDGCGRIMKFTSTGSYLTQWASSGVGVAVDAAGDVYVADVGSNRIQKFTSTGSYLTQWGSAGSGDGQFNGPIGVAADASGNVYVADRDNNRIQMFTSNGDYIAQWGSEGSGNGQFFGLTGLATDALGNVYVSEMGCRIQKFGHVPTSTKATSWGRLKRMYR